MRFNITFTGWPKNPLLPTLSLPVPNVALQLTIRKNHHGFPFHRYQPAVNPLKDTKQDIKHKD